jgi:N-methylhydantoinase A
VASAKTGERDVCFDASAGLAPCAIYDRDLLAPGHAIAGPAVIEQLDSTTVVYPGQRALVDEYLNIVITV